MYLAVFNCSLEILSFVSPSKILEVEMRFETAAALEKSIVLEAVDKESNSLSFEIEFESDKLDVGGNGASGGAKEVGGTTTGAGEETEELMFFLDLVLVVAGAETFFLEELDLRLFAIVGDLEIMIIIQ